MPIFACRRGFHLVGSSAAAGAFTPTSKRPGATFTTCCVTQSLLHRSLQEILLGNGSTRCIFHAHAAGCMQLYSMSSIKHCIPSLAGIDSTVERLRLRLQFRPSWVHALGHFRCAPRLRPEHICLNGRPLRVAAADSLLRGMHAAVPSCLSRGRQACKCACASCAGCGRPHANSWGSSCSWGTHGHGCRCMLCSPEHGHTATTAPCWAAHTSSTHMSKSHF